MSEQGPPDVSPWGFERIGDPPPPFDEATAAAAIAALKALDRSRGDIDALAPRVKDLLTGYLVRAPILPPGLRFWRARIAFERPQTLNEVSYPPAELLTTLGRVNRPHLPVFYCSHSWRAAVVEVRPQPGDEVVLSCWENTAPLLVNTAGYAPVAGTGRAASWWRDADASDFERCRIVHDFIAEVFAEDVPAGAESRYALTVAIAEVLAGPQFDGLVYPTVAMKRNADNLAITAAAADSKLRLRFAECLRIDAMGVEEYSFRTIDHATVTESGSLEWLGRPGEWVVPPGELVRAQVVDGRWELRARDGKVLDPG